ncbi:MmgE/PrpD family protein [Acuticoccus sp. I52.16.1]|uniref:MmgE/PrpD family protein n=1 Tax=Acuticoccus sp. I52.16.1 TaxID=2928472 RepID=UPI001FD412B1|nr:MmgE/PrpD family protein [Acuticoccus sp. I52.16.1]UOM35007.1 MmgE/PrpD family protein [Acuticoccus sp. I52.16.1]
MSDHPETELARFAAELTIDAIPEAVRHEARRSLVNVFATMLAGCREGAIDITLGVMRETAGAPTAGIVGRPERTDAATAAFINAMAANIFDFDDTHEATIIHPAAIPAAGLFAEAETRGHSGARLLTAFVAGGEVECRLGNAVSPSHYARGWHITSTCGVFGAAAGVGSLLGLSPERMRHAFSAAAVQSSGLVEMLGTMAKSIGVGGAARGGMMAARLAGQGLTGPRHPLTGPRGYLGVVADPPHPEALTDGLGSRWEIARNAFKPYPTGVVLNPVLDAILALGAEGLRLDEIAAITLTGHPLLRERTDRADVATGREGQVSAHHAIAIALLEGRAGLGEFTDAAAARTLAAGRPPISFHDDPAREIASAGIVVRLADGTELRREVTAARGSAVNPLSDAALEDKLADCARYGGYRGDVRALADALWTIDEAPDVGAIMRLATAAA